MNWTRIYIALFVVFGVICLFMRPPYQLVDECNHLSRAWQISEGIFLSPTMTIGEYNDSGDFQVDKILSFDKAPADALKDKTYIAQVPVSFLPDKFTTDIKHKTYRQAYTADDVKDFLATPLNVNECELAQISNTGVYAPPAYLPQAVAALIGRTLNLNAGIIFYLMGLSGLIFVAACVWLAMKFLPEARELIFLVAMLPMFIVESASTSADAVTYGVCLLGTAWLLSLRNSKAIFNRAEVLGLIVLSIMLPCSKSVYGTILLLYFLIPRERCKHFWTLGAAILSLNLFLAVAWSWLSVDWLGVKLFTNYWLGDLEVNTAAQKSFLMENPTAIFSAIFNSLIGLRFFYLSNFIGSWGILINVMMPIMFYVLYSITLIFFALSNDLRFKIHERVGLISAAAVSIFAFFFVHYLKWSPVGADFVEGV